jgi:hypothetical protein
MRDAIPAREACVVLFLDFDGVTHPEPCFQDNVFCRLDLIEAVVRDFAPVEIVITSSWRDHYPLDILREEFALDLRSRVVGVTPSIKNPSPDWLCGGAPAHEREWEIETWLTANRPVGTPWLGIDDRPHWFRENCPNLLVTNSRVGFQPVQQQTLRLMIRQRKDEL